MSLPYHEKQEAGLCAVHAINSLLQGSYFTEVDLMSFAQQLDAQEREVMAVHGTETSDFVKFAAQDSTNVAEDGNFSVQVLEKALEVWNLKLVLLSSPEGQEIAKNVTSANAFICNLMEHWFTIRKIGQQWWNLNSIYPKPQFLSEMYLEMILEQLKVEGYTIFVVQGSLPQCEAELLPEFHMDAPMHQSSTTTTATATASHSEAAEFEETEEQILQRVLLESMKDVK